MYKYSKDSCGPTYLTIGDGGNVEGPYRCETAVCSIFADILLMPFVPCCPEYVNYAYVYMLQCHG